MLRQSDLHVAWILSAFGNRLVAEKPVVSFEIDDHLVALVAGFHLAHPARKHRLSTMNQANLVAQLLHLVHTMGREQNGPAAFLRSLKGILQKLAVTRTNP